MGAPASAVQVLSTTAPSSASGMFTHAQLQQRRATARLSLVQRARRTKGRQPFGVVLKLAVAPRAWRKRHIMTYEHLITHIAERATEGVRVIEPTIRQLQMSILFGVGIIIGSLTLVTGAGVAVTIGANERISARLLPAREANSALLRNMLDRETGIRAYLVQSGPRDLSRYADATTEQPQREAQLRRLAASEDGLLPLVRAQELATERWSQRFALPALSGQRATVDTEAGLAMGDRLIHQVREANGRLAVRLNQSIESDQDRAHRATALMAIVLGLLAVLSLLGGLLYLRWAMAALRRPLDDLEKMAHRLSAGESSARVVPRGAKDVQLVARALNRLAEDSERAQGVAQKVEEELRELDRVRNDFLGNVSHELRTPLTSIGGYLEVLTDELGDVLNDEHLAMFEICLRNSANLNLLIEDLLDLNQVERTPAEFGPVEIDDVLLDVVRDLGHGAAFRGVSVDLTAQSGAMVSGDGGQLRRVLLNLVSNAIKFSYPGGRVRVGARAQEGTVEIFVSDAGIGIPPGEISRLGEQFYRGSNAVATHVGGTGLGLRIVYSIVKQHGGTFLITSPAGQGTTCLVRFTQCDRALVEPLVGRGESLFVGR